MWGEVCLAHGERPTVYCLVCRWAGCAECAPMHSMHDLQPLDHLAKTHKVKEGEGGVKNRVLRNDKNDLPIGCEINL